MAKNQSFCRKNGSGSHSLSNMSLTHISEIQWLWSSAPFFGGNFFPPFLGPPLGKQPWSLRRGSSQRPIQLGRGAEQTELSALKAFDQVAGQRHGRNGMCPPWDVCGLFVGIMLRFSGSFPKKKKPSRSFKLLADFSIYGLRSGQGI